MMAWDMKGAAGGALGVTTAVLEAIVTRRMLAVWRLAAWRLTGLYFVIEV